MRVDEISKLAAYGKPAPNGATAPERLLYLSLGILYTDFKKGVISKQEAAEKKTKIVSVCQGYEDTYNEWFSDHKAREECVRAASTLLSDIEKEKDIVKAAYMAFEVIGLMTGDEGFLERQRRKYVR